MATSIFTRETSTNEISKATNLACTSEISKATTLACTSGISKVTNLARTSGILKAATSVYTRETSMPSGSRPTRTENRMGFEVRSCWAGHHSPRCKRMAVFSKKSFCIQYSEIVCDSQLLLFGSCSYVGVKEFLLKVGILSSCGMTV